MKAPPIEEMLFGLGLGLESAAVSVKETK
jgi:hypothetical protein